MSNEKVLDNKAAIRQSLSVIIQSLYVASVPFP
ncbi:Uncharacterised protein [Salmonella enterica subsp. salamae]|uniref:Uncharacterized protein n=1 Tax=Salmonella enterica TaxID=28901 RepID=A0A379SFV8_SALER|nr:Uncharacterised protein [Salmonella enterica]SUJ09539.1 Uncharacterised protein [Salmonella enterica subsp. salamae]SUG27608.1 Uncharacterised protein [Salmonella enterica]SUG27723.1 Uncharacterised protein [Salmonella enterica]SUJ12084.1 Uncharacterised protein [Salmonella enterica subsp. salamae]